MAERQFGPYQLVKQIAVGGMAEIHLAKTRGIAGFEKFCALKMIHPNFAQDEQFIEMLIDEAKIAVQLQHVNIAQTFDLGRVGETYYITMEFVDGADLYKILRRGSEQDLDIPVDIAAYIGKEMATGLDYAHRKRDGAGNTLGIVHRDVSPQNVLVSNAGEVKLVDFGIAKATMKARQTAVGVIKGKYYYMSPEQAWGERLDHRSDIFSAGIVLYEMLTGQMLYLEEDIHKLLDMVRRANIAPVRTLRRDVPPQLERIVMHALAKKPEDRYQSAGDLAADLERFLHTYSPVFTASKLAQHLRKVLGDPAPPAAPVPEPAPRDPRVSTQSIDRHTYVTNRSEITDENSVIFRVGELVSGQDGAPAARAPEPTAPARSRPPTQPLRTGAGAAPKGRLISASTMPIADPTVGDEAEHTLITGRPSMEGPTSVDGPRGLRAAAEVHEELDYEPTVMEEVEGLVPSGQHHEDDPPTLARLPAVPQAAVEDASTAPRRRPGAPQPAALAAHTPTPAVSELRRPRESRRTPAGGVPAAGSVLQALVGGPSAPMPRPARGAGAPLSDGVPAVVREPAPSNAPTAQVPGRLPSRPPPMPGGALAGLEAGPLDPGPDLPTSPALDTRPLGQPPGMPSTGSVGNAIPTEVPPSAPGLPAHLAPYAVSPVTPPYPTPAGPGQPAPYPFQPYGPAQPMSFTKQMQAMVELDELPPQYRLASPRRALLRALLVALLVGAAVITTVVIIRGSEQATVESSLLIESTPSGATVAVDGQELVEPTPTRFVTAPGARHEIVVTLAGHKPFKDAVVVPDAGGQLRVLAFLPAATVRLRVLSTPPGADVYEGDQLLGRTPLDLRELSPDAIRTIDVRLKGYLPEPRTLDWGGRDELTVDVKLRK